MRLRLFSFIGFALSLLIGSDSLAIRVSELKTGDLILQSLPCSLCRLIEEEEKSPYSHVGMVGFEKSGEKNTETVTIWEAWGTVKATPFADFISRKRKGTEAKVLRPKHFLALSAEQSEKLNQELSEIYFNQFHGLTYDAAFLWDNVSEDGKDTLYCSELVVKLLNKFLPNPFPTKPMHYNSNREAWIRYFKGTPPDNLPGVSPGDLDRSDLFVDLGTLELLF